MCPSGSFCHDDSNDSKDHHACYNGQMGFCIDTSSEECDGADTLEGFCVGASNIKCCPTSKVKVDIRTGCNATAPRDRYDPEKVLQIFFFSLI